MFTLHSTQSDARTGVLQTAHGKVKTPFIMPCATRSTGKCITSDDYASIGVRAIIANALINFMRPGISVFEKYGGIHRFMNYHGTVFTDCGGFQVMRSFHQSTTPKCLVMKDPWSLQTHRITPEKMMAIEQTIGADVVMALDHMPLANASYEEVKKAVTATHAWAQQCLSTHTKDDQLLFGICQGGTYEDLRSASAKVINSLPFDGVAIGGVAIGESREKVWEAVDYALPRIGKEKIRYLMGVGRPQDVVEGVTHGIDCFDSVYPTQTGRRGTLYTWSGKIDLNKGIYKEDMSPVEEDCSCFVCKNYTRAYLRHLFSIDEPVFKRFASVHNITFMQQLMKRIRTAIEEEEFMKFREQFKSVYP